jgi:hypothetical protein
LDNVYYCHYHAHDRLHPAWDPAQDLVICEFSTACGLCSAQLETAAELRFHASRSHGCAPQPGGNGLSLPRVRNGGKAFSWIRSD